MLSSSVHVGQQGKGGQATREMARKVQGIPRTEAGVVRVHKTAMM